MKTTPSENDEPRDRYGDPEAFLLEIVERSGSRFGKEVTERLGFVAGTVFALLAPGGGLLLRGLMGTAIGTLAGRVAREAETLFFRHRLERALDRFEEVNTRLRDGLCDRETRDEVVSDLIERFFDKRDSLLE